MLGVVERTQVASTYLEVRRILFYLSLGIFWISYALQGSSLHQNRGHSTITTISGGLTHLQGSGSGSRPKAKHHQRGVAIEWCLTRSVPQSHREHRHDSVPFDWSPHTITIRGTDCIGSVPNRIISSCSLASKTPRSRRGTCRTFGFTTVRTLYGTTQPCRQPHRSLMPGLRSHSSPTKRARSFIAVIRASKQP